MARKQFIEEGRLDYVPTLTNPAAPTVAGLTAGVPLTAHLGRSGLTTPRSANTMDISDAFSKQNKSGRGTKGGEQLSLTFFRDSVTGSDTAWSTLTEATDGYLVVRRFGGPAVAWAATQKVEVYPIEVISREMQPIAENTPQQFVATCAVPAETQQDATVAV